MAAPEIEGVRRFYRAWSAGDLPGMLAVVDPDVDALPVLGVLYHRQRYRGHAGIAEWFAEVGDLWQEGFEAEVEDARPHGDGVIAFVRLVGHRAGRTLDARIAVECGFRDGRISSFVGHDAEETAQTLAEEEA
jgi:ketosteroid isomerase-like protein